MSEDAMTSGFFRVVRLDLDKGELELDENGLDDPGAEIVYCEWNPLFYRGGEEDIGRIHLRGKVIEVEGLGWQIYKNCIGHPNKALEAEMQKGWIKIPIK